MLSCGGALSELVIEAYSINECPVKFIIMLPKHSSFSPYAYIPYSFMHAIGAPEIAASFELERVNPEGPEVTQETEGQPAGQ